MSESPLFDWQRQVITGMRRTATVGRWVMGTPERFEPPRDESGVLSSPMTLSQMLVVVTQRGEPFSLTFVPRMGQWRAEFEVVNGNAAHNHQPEAAVIAALRMRERMTGIKR